MAELIALKGKRQIVLTTAFDEWTARAAEEAELNGKYGKVAGNIWNFDSLKFEIIGSLGRQRVLLIFNYKITVI